MDPVYVNNGSKPDNEFKINYDQNSHVYLEVITSSCTDFVQGKQHASNKSLY
jgi:hypothetical protein